MSPIADTSIMQVYWDHYFTIGPTNAGLTGYVNFNKSIPIKLGHLKYSGSGAGTAVSESIFLIYSSMNVTGTTAPVWHTGILEFFFIP